MKNLPDIKQSFWQLASIQIASVGVPTFIFGASLARQIGVYPTLISLAAGNLILWLIGITMVSMTADDRSHAIKNVDKYIGKIGSITAAFVLVIAFLSWFVLQTNSVLEAFRGFYKIYPGWNIFSDLKMGIAFGSIIILLVMGGIRWIKWVCIATIPIVFVYIGYCLLTVRGAPIEKEGLKLSYAGVTMTIFMLLAGMVNLPTFFRHSKSKSDSILALSIYVVFIFIIEASSIWVNIGTAGEIFSGGSVLPKFYTILALIYVLMVSISTNLVNVYFASAGWETIMPRLAGAREYAIIGLLGTLVFTFLQSSTPFLFAENMTNSFIASLGVVLTLAFVLKIVVNHRPRPMEKLASGCCWFIGCFFSLAALIQQPDNPSRALLGGVGSTIISFLVLVFFEDSIWAFRSIQSHKDKN